MIKTEAIASEEQTVNQITIQDNSATHITSQNDKRAMVKTETNQRNVHAVSLSNNHNNNNNNNSHTGNTGYVHQHRGQFKQQVPKGPKGVKSGFPTGCSRDLKQSGTGSKIENVCDEEFFDDDDDLLVAVADDDYFGMEEDFDMDMEQIDQLEKDMQITASTTANKTVAINSNTMPSGKQDFEMPCDDEIFEDDFIDEDILAEVTDSMEMKPLHQRISNAETIGQMHMMKKARTSNSSSTEFSGHMKKSSTSNTGTTNIPRKSDVTTSRPSNENFSVNNIKRESISEMNNSTYSRSASVKPELSNKPKNTGALKLSSTKRNAANSNNNYLSSTRRSLSCSSGVQIKKEPDVEVGSSCVNSNASPVGIYRNQCLGSLAQGTYQNIKGVFECNQPLYDVQGLYIKVLLSP